MKKPKWFWYQVGGILLALAPSVYCLWALSHLGVDSEVGGAEFNYLAFSIVFVFLGYVVARVGEKHEEEARIRRIVEEVTKEKSDAAT